jgi:23S rRNA (uracil1939-C5)-methyltransferase
MININDTIEGTISTIAFGGQGIMREKGLVIFIPFTAVGDVVKCRVTEVKKSFAQGELVEIIEPSAERVVPPCPYYGTCGGCQLQHLNENAQVKYKLEAVTDAFKRIGRLSFPTPTLIPATLNWAYRRHITLHLKPQTGCFEAGYITSDNQSIIAVETCPIFNEANDPVIQELQAFLKKLPNPQKTDGRVTLLKNQRGKYIASFYFKDLAIDRTPFKHFLQTSALFEGLLIAGQDKPILLGDCFSTLAIEGLTFHFTPQAFVQNHPEQSLKIYQQICSLVGSKKDLRILDLYCGFGITSLLLARLGHQVTGVEYNAEAIKFAEVNSYSNHLKDKTLFIQGDVERVLPKRQEAGRDLIIMNPPRQGLTPAVKQSIVKAQPKEMIYVSCMPSTLARDLAYFCENGYKIENVTIYDMFPQTAHVETLVHLKQK